MCISERGCVKLEARQLMRAIRGRRSQEAFSRRLGYTSNPVADWEAGRRFPTAAEAIRACRLSGIDVDAALERFRPEEAAAIGEGDDAGVASWMDAVRGKTAVKEVAARVGRSRYAVARWLAGDTRPRLPDFLRMVDALTGRLSDLVAELVPIESVPSLVARHAERRASRHLAFDEPWTEAILRILETAAYQQRSRHERGWVSRRLEIPLEVEERCLARLEAAGIISQDGDEPYRPAADLTVDTRADPEGTRKLKAHWAELALRRSTQPREGDLVSYNVVSVSREDLERIREAHIRYFHEVRQIVSASEPIEVAALVNIHLLSWDAPSS